MNIKDLTRYNANSVYDFHGNDLTISQDKEGEYVKFDEIKEILSKEILSEKTRESNIQAVYNAFNQQGGTIHQLESKAFNCPAIAKRAILAYLFQLFETNNADYLKQETDYINQRIQFN